MRFSRVGCLTYCPDSGSRHGDCCSWLQIRHPSELLFMRDVFNRLAASTARMVGSYWAFLIAALTIVVWAVTGPLFEFSDTWQLVINTGTTIVTFLMVFLIQNTQNRDARAIHLKLDELIHAVKRARDEMIDIEKLTDDELEQLGERFRKIRERCEPFNGHSAKASAEIKQPEKHKAANAAAG
jgi:low affinity Fe/Cu permease